MDFDGVLNFSVIREFNVLIPMVDLVINDYCDGNNPSRFTLGDIDDESTVAHVKLLIMRTLKTMSSQESANEDDTEEAACSMLILYYGNMLMDDKESIKSYNASGLSELILFLYKKVIVEVTVKVYRAMMCCGLLFTPIIHVLNSPKVCFEILDQESVIELKRMLLKELQMYKNRKGLPIPIDDLIVAHNGYELDDDLCPINELCRDNKLHLKLYIPFEYKRRKEISHVY